MAIYPQLPIISAYGNMIADPELRFTASGSAYATIRIACNERRKDKNTGEWTDGDSCFLDCIIWRNAEAVAEKLSKGDKIAVGGVLKTRTYTTDDGQKRSRYEIDVQYIATLITNGGKTEIANEWQSPFKSEDEAPF